MKKSLIKWFTNLTMGSGLSCFFFGAALTLQPIRNPLQDAAIVVAFVGWVLIICLSFALAISASES